jgi:hypothetical protein
MEAMKMIGGGGNRVKKLEILPEKCARLLDFHNLL